MIGWTTARMIEGMHRRHCVYFVTLSTARLPGYSGRGCDIKPSEMFLMALPFCPGCEACDPELGRVTFLCGVMTADNHVIGSLRSLSRCTCAGPAPLPYHARVKSLCELRHFQDWECVGPSGHFTYTDLGNSASPDLYKARELVLFTPVSKNLPSIISLFYT